MRDLDNAGAAALDDGGLSSLEKLIARHREEASGPMPQAQPEKLPAKVYGVMAVTTALTFATLMTGYQLLFPPHQIFA